MTAIGPGAEPRWPSLPSPSGPEDARLDALLEDRFDAIAASHPVFATYLGLHEHDGRLADLSREAKEADMAAERAFIAAVGSVDGDALSPGRRFERDLALHAARLRAFADEVQRTWERRATVSDSVGDGLFLLLARDGMPLEERLDALAGRVDGVPAAVAQVRSRLGERPVRRWNELEVDASRRLPGLLQTVTAVARGGWGEEDPRTRAIERSARAASDALEQHARWLETQLPRCTDEFALGRADLDALIALRALDGLSTDEILAIGWEQLDAQHAARAAAGREIDPALDEAGTVERVKSDHPASFDEAIALYRGSMEDARRFIVERDLATVPPDESLRVIPTPEYLRAIIPFAAYFAPPVFDRPRRGVYIVTPSVAGEARAMREHNRASIVNTSVHEAYPGHHLQLTVAIDSATPSRLLVEAPEFVEGWAMYCEQMMREEGFATSPAQRVAVATDAVWRAARIVLDIRLHRGELRIEEAVDFLVEHTGFERPNARAEIDRYTFTPGYNLSYLLGRIMLFRLRDEERRRLGGDFSLRAFHDQLLTAGSLPLPFHRRLLREAIPG